jgi:hypothetical protein
MASAFLLSSRFIYTASAGLTRLLLGFFLSSRCPCFFDPPPLLF